MIADETLTILSKLVGKNVSSHEAESLFLHLNAENEFVPQAMVGNLIEVLQLQYNAINHDSKIEPVYADILARDRHTGYYIHTALRTLYLDFALSRSGLPGQEERNFLILGDFMNLSSVNEAIGRSATNDVMAIVCGIYLDCMTRAGVVNWLYHRSMGDEITFIVLNTQKAKVLHGLEEAVRTTEEFIQALGLERLRHKKYPDRMGSGLITETVALKPDMDHRTLKQQIDDAVMLRKKTKPTRRFFGIKLQGVEPDQYHNRASEQRVDRAIHRYRHYKSLTHAAHENDGKFGNRDNLNPAQSLLVGRAISWPRDDRIEYLRQHHNDTKIMLRADIYNLGGLNAVYGHDGADQIKAHMIRILYNTICAHDFSEPKVFDCGGGIIDAIINDMPANQLQKLIQAIQNNLYYQILSHSIATYALGNHLSFSDHGETLLSDLPHPRHEHPGTGLVMATHKVDSTRSLPEIIERLDKITHRTKMHEFTYLWADDRAHVFGFALNKVPEPVLIGDERLDPGKHYLPFTDALRQYLDKNHLPNIFERPAGQICETLFGTDMQAVLGFKKAIRMLQEKGVDDNTIMGIARYEDMDAILASHDLPPLSVVSTQNRPSFVIHEREEFMTMALAEKLEHLPGTISGLILQAQAIFRTLKLMQPHGHLPEAQAVQILTDEIAHFTPPNAHHHRGNQICEAVHALARFYDRGFGATGAAIPDDIRHAIRIFSLETLGLLAQSFEQADEYHLAEKLTAYVEERRGGIVPHSRSQALNRIRRTTAPLVKKLRKKKLLPPESATALEAHLETLLGILDSSLDSSLDTSLDATIPGDRG